VSVTPNASLVGLQVYKGRLTRPHLRPAKSFTACHPPQSDWRALDPLLDEHRFRSLGKLVVGNLDWIADVHNIGN
jgi:hypothetical protein